MDHMTEKYAELIKQAFPRVYKDLTLNEVVNTNLCKVISEYGLELPCTFYDDDHKDYDSPEFIERVCAKGYEPIVNDGKLYGFRKIEKAL